MILFFLSLQTYFTSRFYNALGYCCSIFLLFLATFSFVITRIDAQNLYPSKYPDESPRMKNAQKENDRIALHQLNADFKPTILVHAHPKTFKWSANPLKLAIRGLFYIYQQHLTLQLNTNCMYSPSCSEFSRQSISQFGFLKGLALTTDRLSRCTRYHLPYNQKMLSLSPNFKFYDPPKRHQLPLHYNGTFY